MRRLLLISVFTAPFLMAQANNAPLELERAIQLARGHDSVEDADLAVARSRLLFLEAAAGKRIEITPQSAIWSLANPISLAANLGASFLFSGNSVSPHTILDAKIDVASAEIAAQQARFAREMEATEKYLELALQQSTADRACDAVSGAQERRNQALDELAAARVTRVDLVRYEQQIIARKSDCLRADQEMQLAASNLAALLKMAENDLRVSDLRNSGRMELPLQSSDSLYRLAAAHRADIQETTSVQRVISDLWDELEKTRESQMRIVLKDNGAFEAGKAMLAEKLRRLDLQGERLESQIQASIVRIRIRAEALRDQLKLARERVALLVEQQQGTTARVRAGLANRDDLINADEARRQADFEVARLQHEGSAHVAILITICGLRGQPESVQALVYDNALYEASLP